jgi:hypothetical protein
MNFTELYEQIDLARRMADAATTFLASLRPDQVIQAQLSFEDQKMRRDWHYIPRDRTGLALRDMEAHQRDKAFSLLDTGLGKLARQKVRTIIGLEPILAELEGPARIFPRDPELYDIVIFGRPGDDCNWSWRFEGHHISVNYTIVNSTLVAPTPIFFGANPAHVRHGEHKGLRTLKEEEDLARDLLASLDGEQKKEAIINAIAPDDILTRNVPRVGKEVTIEGLQLKDMTASQQDVAIRLIDVYIKRLPEFVAEAQRQKIETTSLDAATFAWAGGVNRGEGHYYRLHGYTFLAEYDCTQNQANHIHAVWRDLTNDFGDDILKQHYKKNH